MHNIAIHMIFPFDLDIEKRAITEQLYEINKIDNIKNIFLSINVEKHPFIRDLYQTHHVQILSHTSSLKSIVAIQKQGIEMLMRIYCSGHLIKSNTLKKLLVYHTENKSIFTIFKPTVPHAVRSPFRIADVINLRDFTIPSAYRQKIVSIIANIILRTAYSVRIKRFFKRISYRLKASRFIFLFKKYIENINSTDVHLDIFKGKITKYFSEKDKFGTYIPGGKVAFYGGTRSDAEYLLIDHIRDYIPLAETLFIITSNVCNLRCIMCPIWSPKYSHSSNYYQTKRFMTSDLFKKIALEAGKVGSTIRIGMVEEPLLNPEIVEFVRVAKNAGVPYVGITSNATLLKRETAEMLIRAGLDSFSVSLDAMTAETYKKVRGGNLFEVLKNVDELIGLKHKLHSYTPELEMVIIDQEPATHEVEKFIHYWLSRVSSVTVNKLTTVENNIDVLKGTSNDANNELRTPCVSPWRELVVTPEGEVLSCCIAALNLARTGIFSLGNVNQQNLRDIWSGEAFNRLRRNILYNKFDEHSPHCLPCKYWVNIEETIDHRFNKGIHIMDTKWVTNYRHV